MSPLGMFYVITSHRRLCDVILTPNAYWVLAKAGKIKMEELLPLKFYLLTLTKRAIRYVIAEHKDDFKS